MKGTFFKHFKISAAVCGATLAVMLASCSNFIETENVRIKGHEPESCVKTGDMVTVYITADEEIKNHRVAYPELSTRDGMVTYELSENGEVLATWKKDTVNNLSAYRKMQEKPASLTEGTHTLTLTGTSSEGTKYAGTLKNVEVTEGSVLNFTLYFAQVSETGSGRVSILAKWPENKATRVKFSLYNTNDKVTPAGDALYTNSYGSFATEGVYNSVICQFNINSYPAGCYIAKIEFFADEDCTVPLGSTTELVYITQTKNSSSAVTLDALQTVYMITYNFNGGSLNGTVKNSAVTQKYSMMQDITLYGSEYGGNTSPDSVTKENLDFAGWYADSSFTLEPVTGWGKKTTAQNITLYAKWNYNVTFEANGSDETPVTGYVFTQAAKEGDSVKLNKNTFKRTGYLFNGWNTAADGSGTTYEDCSTLTSSAHTTLYAQWLERDAEKVAVSFRANGGTLVDIQEVTAGSTLTEPVTTYTHNTFVGWYTTETFTGDAVDFETFAPTEDVTLYAKWTPEVYAITYKDVGDTDFSGVQAEGYPQTHTYGTETKLKTPYKEDCEFMGWFTDSDGTGTELTQLGAASYEADLTLYAKWVRISYHVSADGSNTDGDGSKETPYATVAKAVTSISSANTKIDYKIVIHGEVTENVSLTTDNLPQDNAKSLTLRGASNNTVDILNGNAAGRVLTVGSKVPVTIEDLALTNGKGGIEILSGSRVTLEAGALITGNKTVNNYDGGGVLVKGTIYVNEGSEISSNEAYAGGGIYQSRNAVLYINGGTIKNNTARNVGSAIYLNDRMTMNGGTITGHNGTAIYEYYPSDIYMNGGIISNNGTAIYFRLYTTTCGNLYMSGSAYIPYDGESRKNNVVFAGSNGKVVAAGTLTGGSSTNPVVAVTPSSYAYGQQVVSAADGIDIVSEASKIALVPNGEPWIIGSDGKITGETFSITYRDIGNKEFTGENLSELPSTHTYGVATTLVTPVREDYDFIGWFTESSGTGTSYTSITAKQFTSDIMLYARWAKKSVAVEITNDGIELTKTENNGVITLTASAGFTDYLWTVGNANATSAITGSTVSADGKTFTFNTSNLAAGKSYAITVSALDANGIEYSATAQVKK